MKSLLIVFAFFFAFSAQAQVKKDTTKPKINQDSLNVLSIGQQVLQFMTEKNVGVKDFQTFLNIYNAFIEEKKKTWSIK